jgi:hypothetical protein
MRHADLFIFPQDLANRWIDLHDVDTRLARKTTERVQDASGCEALFRLMDSLIGERIAERDVPALDVVWARVRLRSTAGLASISSLTRDLDSSHKRLLAQFREHRIALAPDRYGTSRGANRDFRGSIRVREPAGHQ